VERLKVKALSSNLSTTKEKKKYPTQKRAGRVAHMVEHLPSKYEVLNSNPNTPKQTNKQTK
jgi:hypothetical protein